MSFPSQRFFSLSNSNNNATAAQQATTTATTAANNSTSRFLDQNSLDLLVRAASGSSGGAAPSSAGNNNANNMNNGMPQMSGFGNPAGATPVDGGNSQGQVTDGNNGAPNGTPTMDNTNNNNLQQAFLQSMASQQAAGSHPSAMFAAPGAAAAGGFGTPNAAAAQQLGQFFGNIQAVTPQGNIGGGGTPGLQGTANGGMNPQGGNAPAGAPQAQLSGTPVGAAAAAAGAGGQQGTNMISQLVASLQAQQQAQQQAQVQAALVRAFGPGANANNPLANAAAGNPMAAIQAQAQGTQGLGAAAAGGMAGGIQSLNNSLLSKMGFAQSAQQQQQQVQQQAQQVQQAQQQQQQQQAQQQVQQQQQQQQANQQAAQVNLNQQNQNQQVANNTNNNTFDATKAATVAAVSAGNATADDLIKLQFEQERHNRMLQMVQADRQERAMLANQEALMKKQRSGDVNVAGGNPAGNVGADLSAVTMNDAVKNMFNQFPNANTLVANAAAAGFPNAGLLGLNQNLANNLQNGLINAAGLPNLAGLGGVGSDPTAAVAAEQHLHQKLGSARGAAIVPCRARGMPVDHNFKTAYFVIPDGIEHGDELMCSYPACRQAGVKFRYCLHCKVPVAKRNFRNRHRHGVPGGDGASGSDVEEESEEEETTENGASSPGVGGDICQPVGVGGEEDYSGVKKEHVLIIPGADNTSMPMKKKKKKNVRVPCRARGMPMAHNFKTAYFIIPPTIEHGDELLCSFPSCRSAGAKFRYCLHCKVPVAKRNFRNRHKHGNLGSLDKKKSASGGSLKTPESLEQKTKSEEGTKSNDSSLPELPGPKTEEKPTAESGSKPSGESESAASSQAAAAADDDEGKVTIETSHDAGKVQKWVELLENKPNPSDKQAMAVWMLNLMNATEGGVPSAAATAIAAPAPAAASAEKPPAAKEEVKREGNVAADAQDKGELKKPPFDGAKEEVKREGNVAADAQDKGELKKPPFDGDAAVITSNEEGPKRDVVEEENDAESTISTSSQPPKKKFKQEFEEV